MKKFTRGMFPVLAVILGTSGARATVVTTPVSSAGPSGQQGSTDAQFTYDPTISATDLINAGRPSFAGMTSTGTTSTGGAGGGTVDKLNDGIASGKTTSAGTNDLSGDTFFASGDLNGNPTVTFNLNTNAGTGGSTQGYTLTSISSINGWQDTRTFSDQKYTVQVTTTSNATFTTLATVDYVPFTSDVGGTDFPHSSKVTLTDTTGTLATGVTAIRFNFSRALTGDQGLTQDQSGQVIREFDVFGSSTPEPGSACMIALCTVGLLRRRRRARAS